MIASLLSLPIPFREKHVITLVPGTHCFEAAQNLLKINVLKKAKCSPQEDNTLAGLAYYPVPPFTTGNPMNRAGNVKDCTGSETNVVGCGLNRETRDLGCVSKWPASGRIGTGRTIEQDRPLNWWTLDLGLIGRYVTIMTLSILKERELMAPEEGIYVMTSPSPITGRRWVSLY
ncbi:hypothetical protein RRG08_013187 [Elysia crispata]|uniref:Uncharacterized protein n=1 Tax=Elysia crispata TaxID=231223 RepID=A0AAE1EA07_9GAST|nr:hypothetical protein RRG08_013187 [Elysia crispata]